MDATAPRFCIYTISQSGKDVVSVAGTIWPTRAETVVYLKGKAKLVYLSAVDDSRFGFTIGDTDVDDEVPGMWAHFTGTLSADPTPTIHLEIAEEPIGVKIEAPLDVQANLRVEITISSSSADDYVFYFDPNRHMSRLFARYAEVSGRNVGKLEFKLDNTDGRLDGEQTCAEAGVVTSARIIATDKEERVHINAVAGSSTGPGTRRERSTSTDGGAARAADDRGPHADHQPRPSAPTDNSTADHRPISGTPARLPRPEATSTSSASSTAPAALDPTADREAQARADDNAFDSDAGGSSPDYDNPPTKKKAKVVKEKPTKPAAASKRRMSVGERAYKPSSATKKGRVQGEKSEGRGGRRLAMDARADDSDMHENGTTQPQPSVKHATGSTSASARNRHQPPVARPRSTAATQSASSSKEAAVPSVAPSSARQASGDADDEPAWHSSLPTPARSPTSPRGSLISDDDEQNESLAAPPPPAPKYAAKFGKTLAANGKGRGKVKKRALAQDEDDDAPPPPPRDVFDADEGDDDDQPAVQAGSSKKKKKRVLDSDDDDYEEVPTSPPKRSSVKARRTQTAQGPAADESGGSERGQDDESSDESDDGDGVEADARLVRMYICPPRPMDLTRKVWVTKDWDICIDEVADKTTDLPSGRTSSVRHSTTADLTPTRWRFTELHLKPRVSLPLPIGSFPPGDVVPFEQDPAPFDYPSTVLLTREESYPYLRKTLLALGAPDWRLGTLPIQPVQHSPKPVYTHVLLRFVPQAACAAAVKIELDPPTEVETRLFYIYQGITADQAAEAKYDGIRGRAEDDVRGWREMLNVPAEEKQNDASLMRLCECGGMEVIGR